MEHIYQRTSHDCGVAALAMFTGKTYEEMLELCLYRETEDDLPVYREGWGMNKEYEILKRLGLWNWHGQSIKATSKVIRINKPNFLDAEFMALMCWGRRALMCVPSLNIEGGFHFVCYDGNKILDPNDPSTGKKVYTKLEEVRPLEIYLMKEINDE